MAGAVPTLPLLRFGQEYASLDLAELRSPRDGRLLARVGQANPGLVRRDLARRAGAGAAALRAFPAAELVRRCRAAARHFLEGTLPLAAGGPTQTPEQYVALLSETSGLPHTLCRANMRKVFTVLDEMETILAGLTRGMSLDVLDEGVGEQGGVPVCYAPTTETLGVVLPSNSPGVNSIWIPALPLKTAVALKPGREEPWTPLRLVRAFLAAGFPAEAFGFYPTSHEGAAAILEGCGRAQLFGDAKTTAPWRGDPRVELHGPGFSKVLVGEDEIDRFEEHLDVLVASILDNGGRSCINASAVVVPRRGREVAEALAARLVAVAPLSAAHPEARLSAFANPKIAAWIDGTIERGLGQGGAEDATAALRRGPRRVELDGATYLLPTIVRCERGDHPLANTEFLFPYASVVELPQDSMLGWIGHSLVVTAITRDERFRRELLAAAHIDRLNLGPVPTSRVDWDQPHEGNLFETLYVRRAIRRVGAW